MDVLITGASGVLGSHVTRIARERGHAVRLLSRSDRTGEGWMRGDVATGEGLGPAVEGVHAVIHCASDPKRHRTTDVAGTAELVKAATHAGGVHIVFPGIVGSDVIPLRYYRSKTAAEGILEHSGLPVTIRRYTQFHDLLWARLSRWTKAPIVPVFNDTRFQVLDTAVAALRLVEAAEHGAAGRLPDLGGPTIYEMRDLATSVAAALGRRRPLIGVNRPGLVGAALRAGGNLTPNRDDTGATWNEFVAARIQ